MTRPAKVEMTMALLQRRANLRVASRMLCKLHASAWEQMAVRLMICDCSRRIKELKS